MSNQDLIVTDDDIRELREKLYQHKKLEEYEKLKQDLFDINFKANNELNEFQGGMKQVDTDKILKRKDGKQTLSDIIVNRFIKMCSLRPVAGNLIGIVLSLVSIIALHYYLGTKELKSFIMIVTYILEAGIGIQIIKSASRSVVLPVFSMLFMTTALANLKTDQTLFQHPILFFQIALVVSILSVAVSVFSID